MSDTLCQAESSVFPTCDVAYEAHAPSQPLRILLPSYRSAPFSGGQGVYIKHLSKALVERGHSVDVISGPPYPHLDPRVGLIKLPSLDLHAKRNGLLALRSQNLTSFTDMYEWFAHNTGKFAEPYTFGRRLTKFLRHHKHRYDIVHDNQSLAWGLLQIARMGLPVIATIHHPITRDLKLALDAEENSFMRALMKRWHSFLDMQKKVSRLLPAIITVSQNTKRDLVSDFGLTEDQMHVIYNGVDTDVFRPLETITRDDKTLMTTASADVPLKGLRYLLIAFSQLRQRHPDLRLVVVGKARAGATDTLIDELGLHGHITFLQNITDEALVKAYAKATIAVCPSLYEGFGFPAAEAMACGVPLVSTTGGALPEVVGDAGRLVEPANATALTDAIDDLLQKPLLRNTLGARGRERMLSHFTWRQAACNYETLYQYSIHHVDR